MNERLEVLATAASGRAFPMGFGEPLQAPRARFDVECRRADPEDRALFSQMMAQVALNRQRAKLPLVGGLYAKRADELQEQALALTSLAWTDTAYNLVTTLGKNDLLDKYLSGSGYTAAWFCGLISSVGYSAIAAADTMASHAGWTEAGGTNAPAYTGARPAMAFSAASAGSKSLSPALTFTFTSGGTVKGAFSTTVATKDGTTGLLYNAALFTSGDRTVLASDAITFTASFSV